MNIIPNIGIGSARFGMTPDEVIAAFQEEQQYELWMGGNLNNSLLYHGMILGFDKCDGQGPLPNSHLVDVQIHGRRDARIWGQKVNLWTMATIIGYLKQENIQHEIQASGDLTVLSLNLSLSFNEEHQLDYIEFWEVKQEIRDEEIRIFDWLIQCICRF